MIKRIRAFDALCPDSAFGAKKGRYADSDWTWLTKYNMIVERCWTDEEGNKVCSSSSIWKTVEISDLYTARWWYENGIFKFNSDANHVNTLIVEKDLPWENKNQ